MLSTSERENEPMQNATTTDLLDAINQAEALLAFVKANLPGYGGGAAYINKALDGIERSRKYIAAGCSAGKAA